jgi:hypothetical protein
MMQRVGVSESENVAIVDGDNSYLSLSTSLAHLHHQPQHHQAATAIYWLVG